MKIAATCVAGLAALLLAVGGPAGCQSAAPRDNADARVAEARRAATTGDLAPVPLRELGYTTRWQTDLRPVRAGGVSSIKLLDNLLVAVERDDRLVTAIAHADAEPRWKRPLAVAGDRLFAPSRQGDRILVHSPQQLFVLDADNGNQIRRYELDQHVAADGVNANGMMVFGGVNGKVYGVDVDAGYARWAYQLASRVVAPPLAMGDEVIVADDRGTYASIDANSGNLNWRRRALDGIVAQPTLHRGNVLLPSLDRTLYAANRSTGRDDWLYRADQPLNRPAVSVGRDAFLPLPNGTLVALNPDGTAKWSVPGGLVPVASTERGIVAHTANTLVLLDPANGDTLRSVDAGPIQHVVADEQGSLVIVSPTGRAVRLDPVK